MNNFDFNMSINEMAKNTNYRTVDDKTWASVASTCSKNRDNDAANVKPLSKLTKDDLVNRYVVALIVMKKQCPTNENDIETIGTFKNYAFKALEMGATLKEIQRIYNINMGIPVDDNAGDNIDPNDEILDDIIDDDDFDDDNFDDDEIDPNNEILNNIINNSDEWDENKLNAFINDNKGSNNNINCPIKYSDYDNDDDFINALNDYINSIKGTVNKTDKNGRQIGMCSNKYLEYGNLYSIDSISTNGNILYISTHGDSAQMIKPLNNELFTKYNKWQKIATRMRANVSLSYVATKLIKIFNNNGFHIKQVCTNYSPEDYE
ncbi:MAG: hypothetical protein [Wendovervirus sonii]|uniref:Uncharacterized protein n=1 Tax=phage Lak_Megaphage_Sonny TaxID=3109229 RepID=A0ABZ0Z2J8_9CAUD|nr:MAG: hypothetical protein [phage Lak_Megaphage_Sonny]